MHPSEIAPTKGRVDLKERGLHWEKHTTAFETTMASRFALEERSIKVLQKISVPKLNGSCYRTGSWQCAAKEFNMDKEETRRMLS